MEKGDLYKARIPPEYYQNEKPEEGNRFQSPNVRLCKTQANCFQQPQFSRNTMSSGCNFPARYSFQDSGEPSAYNVIHNPVQNGFLHYPDQQIDGGSLIDAGGGDNGYRHQYGVHRNLIPQVDYRNTYERTNGIDHNRYEDARFLNAGYHTGYQYGAHRNRAPEVEYRNMNAKSIIPHSSPSNISFSGSVGNADGQTSSKISSSGGSEDTIYVNAGHHRSYRVPIGPPSRTSRHRESTLPVEKQANLSGIKSASATATRITDENNSTVTTSQGPKAAAAAAAASRASSHREVILPRMKQVWIKSGELTVRTSRVESKNHGNVSNMSLIPDKRRPQVQQHGNNNAVKTSQSESSSSYSQIVRGDGGIKRPQVQHGNNNAVKTFPTESSSSYSQIVRGDGGTKANNHRGKPDHTPKYLSTGKSKDFTSHFQKSQSHRTPSSHKVLEKQVGRQPSEKPSKFRKQPSEKPFKQHSEQDLPTSRISWDDGFDEPTTEPFGQNCHLCDIDLAYSPTDEEFDPSILPAVAVFTCGHAFHCRCLELYSSEEQSTDPPCFICFSSS